MNIVNQVRSIQSNGKDVFGNGSPYQIDHTWPASLGGTDANLNMMKLSGKSNQEKSNNTSGVINGCQYAVLKQTSGNTIYGRLFIKVPNTHNDWIEVIK